MAGTRIDVAFIGSCTNARLSDLREAAQRRGRASTSPARPRARRAGIAGRPRGRRTRRAGQDVPRRRLRMARRRLLDVPGDEPRSARRPRDLRVVVEPQLQGPAGQPDRTHAADEPGDGRGGGDRGRGRRRQDAFSPSDQDSQVAGSCTSPHHARLRSARSCCAATTSTPTASCRRGSSRRSRSTASRRTCSRTIGAKPPARGAPHPFDDPARRDARFSSSTRISAADRRASTRRRRSCRRGIRAVVGESFGEIFLGNSLAIGLPCVTASRERRG